MVLLENLLSPPILFFFLGMLAVAVRSDLEIPQPLPRLFSLYLLLAIGFKGGVELGHSQWTAEIATELGLSVLMAFVTPIWVFFLLKKQIGVFDAGALAATYGSISAVTFITAGSFLEARELSSGGHMVAAMALMESPAIIMGVLLVRLFAPADDQQPATHWGHLIKEAVTNASVFLILGSMAVGWLSGASGKAKLEPFVYHIFNGMLAFFLLDMGLVAAKRLRALRKAGFRLVLMGVIIPLLNATAAMAIAVSLDFSLGNAFLFTVLCASASYIAVPAAIRIAIPQASPGLYVPMSLAITFPFNILFGLPLYFDLLNRYLN
jgi:hypothetical protein